MSKEKIVSHFVVTSPFLKKVGTIKAPIYQDQDSKYFTTKDKSSRFIVGDEPNVLTNLRDWITNLKFYTVNPVGLEYSVNWTDTIIDILTDKTEKADKAIDIPELSNFINELLGLIAEIDIILISVLSEVEDPENIHYVFSRFQKARIISHFNFNYRTQAKFYFNDVIARLDLYNPELKKRYFDIWKFINDNAKNQLSTLGYDLTKSPFWQVVINPKMRTLKKLCYSQIEKGQSELIEYEAFKNPIQLSGSSGFSALQSIFGNAQTPQSIFNQTLVYPIGSNNPSALGLPIAGNQNSNFLVTAEMPKEKVKEGKTRFEVFWSITLTTNKVLKNPKIEDIRYLETT
ncbi:MAG: hypothetical protein HYR67_03180 [Bacteroidetes bacterium]|nr:hypothetical protein [Bacteroidota bacterium]